MTYRAAGVPAGIILLVGVAVADFGWCATHIALLLLETLIVADFMYDPIKNAWRSPIYRSCTRCHDGWIRRLGTSTYTSVAVCPDCHGSMKALRPVWRRPRDWLRRAWGRL
jgi:hypothetical protein